MTMTSEWSERANSCLPNEASQAISYACFAFQPTSDSSSADMHRSDDWRQSSLSAASALASRM